MADDLEDGPDEDQDDAWVSGFAAPGEAATLAEAATAVSASDAPPEIEEPLDGPVKLPGGFRRLDGSRIEEVRKAWVRELNGEDEENIARLMARKDASLNDLVDVLLESGVTRLGDSEPSSDDLRNLLVGDRDYLLLEISRATYGNEIDYEDFQCYQCQGTVNFAIRLDEDVPITHLDKFEDQEFDIPLRRGRIAKVRLPNGDDQQVTITGDTVAEMNSALLNRIVLSFRDGEDGEEELVSDDVETVRRLSIKDRRTILEEVTKRQPGPRYNEITFTHDECKREVVVPFGLMSLFPGIV